MGYFLDVEHLETLEKQEKWNEARELLYKMWENEKLNSEKLIRLFSECWYVLSLWECCINKEKLSFYAFQNTLIECTEFGIQNHMKKPRFLCIAGYMISMFPNLFYVNGTDKSYAEWEQNGIDMLRESCEFDPNDRIAKVLFLGTKAGFTEYRKEKKLLRLELASFFPNETAIEQYFKEILNA